MVHSITDDQLLDYYRIMHLIRETELEISRRYHQGKMRCPTHLSVGQEAIAAALSLFLTKDDYAVSTHRGHAHYLAKGGNLNAMIAELYGKETGCSKGRGGSMHLADKSVNFMGTSAIVGNSIPVGTGLGLAAKLDGLGAISVVYLGDAAVEEGVFYESLNFAAVAELPVLFVCENNGYSVYTDMSPRQPKGRSIVDLSRAIGVEARSFVPLGDQSDLETVSSAIDFVRNKRSPLLLEVTTVRFLEHCGPNDDSHLNYRDTIRLSEDLSRDCLPNLRKNPLFSSSAIKKIEDQTASRIRTAFEFAEASPDSKMSSLEDWSF